MDRVRPKAGVIAEAQKRQNERPLRETNGLMPSKTCGATTISTKVQRKSGFRGDQVKDETGFVPFFIEQGASASQMAAAKFLDTIARMPGMAGQAADAVKAYTQVPLEKAHTLLGLPQEQCPETWISLPPSRRPASWKKYRRSRLPVRTKLIRTPIGGTAVGKTS